MRESLRYGVKEQHRARVISRRVASRLRTICDRAGLEYFYPVVYRVDIDAIDGARKTVAGSGVAGSREVLVSDLREGEFDLLFADNAADPDFQRLILDEGAGVRRTSAAEALSILETRLIP